MSNVGMTLDARDVFTVMDAKNGVGEFSVTSLACGLSNEMVVALDLNVVGKSSSGEGKRVEETVGGLDGVLAGEIVRRMAVIAHGDGVMTALYPSGVVILHDMAVCAGFRIIGEVGVSPGVNEGVETEADEQTEQDTEGYGRG